MKGRIDTEKGCKEIFVSPIWSPHPHWHWQTALHSRVSTVMWALKFALPPIYPLANIARQPSLSWNGERISLNTEKVNAPGSVLNSLDSSADYIFRRVNLHTLLLSHLDHDLDRGSGLSPVHTPQLPPSKCRHCPNRGFLLAGRRPIRSPSRSRRGCGSVKKWHNHFHSTINRWNLVVLSF